jgi:hypothetical protein
VGIITQSYLANCHNRIALHCYKGETPDPASLLFVISEFNCNCQTCQIGEGTQMPTNYYYNFCCTPGCETCLWDGRNNKRMCQLTQPGPACWCTMLWCCYGGCDTKEGVDSSCGPDTCCWYAHRTAVWPNTYQSCCNPSDRLREPSIWKEFNGFK